VEWLAGAGVGAVVVGVVCEGGVGQNFQVALGQHQVVGGVGGADAGELRGGGVEGLGPRRGDVGERPAGELNDMSFHGTVSQETG